MEFTLILLTTIISISIFLPYWLRKLNYYYWKKRGIPYYESPPIFGIAWDLILGKRGWVQILGDIYRSNKDAKLIGFFQFTAPTILVRDPDISKCILINDFSKFIDRYQPLHGNDMYSSIMPNLSGYKWRKTRRALVKVFSSYNLKNMIPQMLETCHDLVDIIDKQNLKPISIKELLTDYVCSVHAKNFFGYDLNLLKNKEDDLSKQLSMCTTPIAENSLMFMVKFMFATTTKPAIGRLIKLNLSKHNQLFCPLAEELIKKRTNEDFKRNDILQSMLDKRIKYAEKLNDSSKVNNSNEKINQNPVFSDEKIIIEKEERFSNHEIAAQLFTFLVAAKEVAASLLTFTLYNLAIYPTVQEEAYDQLKKLFDYNNITYESIKNLKILDQIIYETNRLYPQTTPIFRICNENYRIPGSDIMIDKGTHLIIPTAEYYKDPIYFPQPHIFNHNRFKNKDEINGNVYAPYSLGPRNCIASRYASIELKLVLAILIMNYKICIKTDTNLDSKTKYTLFMGLEGKIKLVFEKRIK